MQENKYDVERFRKLVDRAIENVISEPERRELEQIACRNEEALKYLTDSLYDAASLSYLFYQQGDSFDLDAPPELERTVLQRTATEANAPILSKFKTNSFLTTASDADLSNSVIPKLKTSRTLPRLFDVERPFVKISTIAVLACSIFVSCVGLFYLFKISQPRSSSDFVLASNFVTLSTSNYVSWGECTIPTLNGVSFGAAVLELKEGIARLRFDCDAQIVMEGPCRLSVVDSKTCSLEYGKITGEALSAKARGFLVKTPQTDVVDLGTKFCINVSENATTDVFVLSGKVKVLERDKNRTQIVAQGKSFTNRPTSVQDASLNNSERQKSQKVVQLSTALGRGKEAWVVRNSDVYSIASEFPVDCGSQYLLLKNVALGGAFMIWDRKCLFSIDVESIREQLKNEKLADVKIFLAFGPTGIGFSANVPDATFSLYGLTDETLDDWDAETVCWSDMPGNASASNGVDPLKTTLLGRFVVEQGVLTKTVCVEGDALKEFVRNDENELLTFVVVRDTPETIGQGLTHGIATREHPSLSPPRLQLAFE